jgi:hypothetical protein
MEEYCSTGQSPQRAVVPMEEEEEEEDTVKFLTRNKSGDVTSHNKLVHRQYCFLPQKWLHGTPGFRETLFGEMCSGESSGTCMLTR